jgi:hypothetical protein
MTLPSVVRAVSLSPDDWAALQALPWGTPLDAWRHAPSPPDIIDQRQGLARHPVLFVRAGGRKYAIKETSPWAAEIEIASFREVLRRGCPSLVPIGTVTVAGEAIAAGEISGVTQYVSGDVGYCITELMTRVLPHSLLYQYPFTEPNKRLLLIAVARLFVSLHESGVYWGDASLANVLIRLSSRDLTAILADAETVECFPSPLSEALRRADLEFFLEAMQWQSEDIRLARGLSEDESVLDTQDQVYFRETYERLRQNRRWWASGADIEGALERLRAGVTDIGARAWHTSVASIEALRRPSWYRERLRDLMGVWIPRPYARRVYDFVLGHKWFMSEAADHDVGLADAAADYRARYHDPVVALLETYAPGRPIDYDRYFAIMQHVFDLSVKAERPIPIQEGAIDYLLPRHPA